MSSRSLSGIKFSLKMTASIVNTLTDGSSVAVNQPALSYAPSLANGTSANQADCAWQSVNRTLTRSNQAIFDLWGNLPDIGAGVGKDALGLALTFQEIVAIVIVNNNAVNTLGSLEITPSSSEGWPPIGSHTVANGGALLGQGMLCKIQLDDNGFDVSVNKHRITLKAIGGDVNYSIYLLGRTDDEESSSSSLSSSSSSQSSSSSLSSISTSSVSTSSSSQSTSSSSSSRSSQSSQSSVSTSSSSQSPSESSSSLSSQSV